MTASDLPSLILTGPTGIGKTELAVRLALRHGGELISADSMQVYKGLAIGTGQPTLEDLAGVGIHCCGIIEPGVTFNAKEFLEASDRARSEILGRGRSPIYVGGTGLYLRALRWGLFEDPEAADAERAGAKKRIRAALKEALRRDGLEAVRERLRRVDPVSAERIHPNDAVRIIRALEVAELRGAPLAELQTEWNRLRPRFPHVLVILNSLRPALVARIERRVDAMLASGWTEEVRRLLEAGCPEESHCFKALGYAEVISRLKGETTEEEMIASIKARTRQFAKRQMTWFRKEHDAVWMDYDGASPEAAVEKIEKVLEGGAGIL